MKNFNKKVELTTQNKKAETAHTYTQVKQQIMTRQKFVYALQCEKRSQMSFNH